mmetsp:Transcript_3168/g.4461  ORF Transcript_3168/g.4461 Transcript_3168/m.4461 type:complete len:736 (-) Transcript_3168:25-2232(-)
MAEIGDSSQEIIGKTVDDGGVDGADGAASGGTGRKRRISKKERKAQKRQKIKNANKQKSISTSAIATVTVSPVAPVSPIAKTSTDYNPEEDQSTENHPGKTAIASSAIETPILIDSVQVSQKKQKVKKATKNKIGTAISDVEKTTNPVDTTQEYKSRNKSGGSGENKNATGKSEAIPSGTPSVKVPSDAELLKNYKAIPVPDKPSKDISTNKGDRNINNDDHEGGGGASSSSGKTLGKWFPSAQLVKCSVNYTNTGNLLTSGDFRKEDIDEDKIKKGDPKSSLVLFYQYTEKKQKWTPTQVKLLMTYLTIIAKKRNIGGRIRVAQEGVNSTLSAIDMPTKDGLTAMETLRHVIQDLKNFDPVFNSTDFKFIDDLSPDRHFKELKVIPVQELVFYGIREEDAACQEGGVHLDATQYHEMLKKENAVVIDVRNHYEAVIGRFDGQDASDKGKGTDKGKKSDEKKSGAEYLDPKMRKSTDFTQWLAKDETKQKLKDKTVLMYCTGGIRCERASAYLKREMGSEVEGVFQLQGGIERYLKAFPDGGFWRGKNFVFDKREAVSANDVNGDGGVIKNKKKSKKKQGADDDDNLPAKCCVCEQKWDRYVGKKKCWTCGVPVLMCEQCMSLKPDKTPGMELKVRCPLCVEENVTVPASEVEFTENGVKNKDSKSGSKAKNNAGKGKAAGSVLKWGGGFGHVAKNKMARKMKARICNFGNDCHRKDCLFVHPGRKGGNNAKKIK